MSMDMIVVILTGAVQVTILVGLAVKLESRLVRLEEGRENVVKNIDELWKQFNRHREKNDAHV